MATTDRSADLFPGFNRTGAPREDMNLQEGDVNNMDEGSAERSLAGSATTCNDVTLILMGQFGVCDEFISSKCACSLSSDDVLKLHRTSGLSLHSHASG